MVPGGFSRSLTAGGSTSNIGVILILDGLTCHDSDAIEDLHLDYGCWIELLPPHSSGQTQPCDVSVFGPLKANMNYPLKKSKTRFLAVVQMY
jgi:hypothetical protein